MQLQLDRSNLAQRVLVASITTAALIAISLVAAYWTWAWFAPSPVSRAQAGVDNAGNTSANGLFGNATQDRNAAPPSGTAIRLLGIVAATPGRAGYAVVEVEPRQILAVHEGDDVTPGIRLAEVGVDHVTLERNGRQEKLTWPEKTKPAEPGPGRTNR